MDSTKKEFWLKLVAAILRKIFFTLGVYLETHGFIEHDYVIGLSAPELMQYLAGFVLIGGTLLWQYRATWFNVVFPKAAHQADASNTTLAEVKKAVIESDQKVSAV